MSGKVVGLWSRRHSAFELVKEVILRLITSSLKCEISLS